MMTLLSKRIGAITMPPGTGRGRSPQGPESGRYRSNRSPRQQRELTGADVGVETVSTAPGRPERAEQSAVRLAKRDGIEFAGEYGSVDARVSAHVAHVDRQVARVDLDVLVSRDVFDADVAEGDSGGQIGIRRDANRD